MDSIVDAFFPLLKDIQKEVLLVEDFVSGLEDISRDNDGHNPFDLPEPRVAIVIADDTKSVKLEEEKVNFSEKYEHDRASKDTKKKKRSPLRKELVGWWRTIRSGKHSSSTLRDTNRLRRMTITRRLVTTLGRLLSAKSEVIAQTRKRLDGQGEVAIYLGDVQDHIISLHQSLMHYERMLSHSHPAYVTHLRFSLSNTKSGLDRALVLLSMIGMLVMCTQVISSSCSLNVHLPRSNDDFSIFGIVVAAVLIVSLLFLVLVRYWYIKAHGGTFWIKTRWSS